ncbi:AI-2E family transporter [Natrinema salifodinae]|uniref:Predicted PurR-regulated permease PerM n=1 Tax=Natrinema salifodinae TaxID=1202768 RepID=A0A1I0MAG0_9EURY|nr:AI-2E family transporter [Natrinema salifodinae]SEV85467.1 Predicted PurR-regulated permease PerM [Natrinema salifodinae]
MADRHEPPAWVVEQPVLTALALGSTVLALFIILPYLQYVLFGVVLAYILVPLQRRLEEYVRPMIAAFVSVVVAILVIVLPLAYILSVALRQTGQLVTAVRNGDVDIETIERALADRGYAVDLAGLYESYQDAITGGLQGFATGALDIVGGLPGIAIGLTITLFVCFALLRDGDRLLAWSYHVLPLDDEIQRELFAELDELMQASVISNVLVAVIQAVLLGVGLAVLGIPAVVLLTVLTFLLTLLPLVGAFGVWLPVSLYLVAIGRPVAAAGLAVYGLLVTLSDTYLRPALIGRTSAFNSAIIVVGIFGGLIAFGAVGLFVGPVVLGGAKLTLDIFARERIDGTGTDADADDETEAVAAESTTTEPEAADSESERRAESVADPDADPDPDPASESESERDADS